MTDRQVQRLVRDRETIDTHKEIIERVVKERERERVVIFRQRLVSKRESSERQGD